MRRLAKLKARIMRKNLITWQQKLQKPLPIWNMWKVKLSLLRRKNLPWKQNKQSADHAWSALFISFHSIHRIPAWGCIKLCSSIDVSELVDRARRVGFAPPGDRLEGNVSPVGGDQSAIPFVAAIVEHVDKTRLIPKTGALHDIETIIHIKDIRRAGRVFFMCADQCRNAIWRALQCKVVIEIIMPEHTGITFMGEDIAIRKQLIVDDGTSLIAQVMILNEDHSGLGLLLQNGFPCSETIQAECVLIA